jgi:hypothetical protein
VAHPVAGINVECTAILSGHGGLAGYDMRAAKKQHRTIKAPHMSNRSQMCLKWLAGLVRLKKIKCV